MPLEAMPIKDFSTPLMRQPKHAQDLAERIASLYATHPAFASPAAETASHIGLNTNTGTDTNTSINNANTTEITPAGQAALNLFRQAFRQGHLLYVGMFNDKPIAALGVFDDGQTNTRRLQYLAVHPENAGRGIDAKMVKLVYDAEVKKGVRRFVPADEDIHQIMCRYELLAVK